MNSQHSRSRRDFISKFTAVVSGGAALAASSGMVQAAPEPDPAPVAEKPASKGYQRTEHVDTYYRLADF
jgi:hypothetical protein